jgi:hypothetical protein
MKRSWAPPVRSRGDGRARGHLRTRARRAGLAALGHRLKGMSRPRETAPSGFRYLLTRLRRIHSARPHPGAYLQELRGMVAPMTESGRQGILGRNVARAYKLG